MIYLVKFKDISKKDLVDNVLSTYINSGNIQIVHYVNLIPTLIKIKPLNGFDVNKIQHPNIKSINLDEAIEEVPGIIYGITHSFDHPDQEKYFSVSEYSDNFRFSGSQYDGTPLTVPIKSILGDRTPNGTATYDFTFPIHVCTDLTSSNKNWGLARCTIPNESLNSQSISNYQGNNTLPTLNSEVSNINPEDIEWISSFNSSSGTNINPGENQIILNPDFDPNARPGCTNPFASNFDPNANTDDGSCVFDTSTVGATTTQNIFIPQNSNGYLIGSFIDLDGQEVIDVFNNNLYIAGTNTKVNPGDYFSVIKNETGGGAIADPSNNLVIFAITSFLWNHEDAYQLIIQPDQPAHDLELRVTGNVRPTTTTTFTEGTFRQFQYCGIDPVPIMDIFGPYASRFGVIKNHEGDFFWGGGQLGVGDLATLEPGKGYQFVGMTGAVQTEFTVVTAVNDVIPVTQDPVIEYGQTHIIKLNQQIVTISGNKSCLFSTYIDISNTTMEELILNNLYINSTISTPMTLNEITGLFVLFNNVDGESYIPAADFDGIQLLTNGSGYRAHFNLTEEYNTSTFTDALLNSVELRISGDTLINTTIEFQEGFTLFGLPVNEERDPLLEFAAHADKILQFKDTSTGTIVSFPHNYNGIGNLIPGRVYSVKTNQAFTKIF